MKYLKYYENIDPYEEEWESEEPYTEFENWLLTLYPDENEWSEIKALNCSYNNLTSLKGIENLRNLKVFGCFYNDLTSLEGIENLRNLEVLYCSSNKLTSLKGIENLRNLKVLWCYNNNLTSLEGIENLTNLKGLYCHNNNFSEEYEKYIREYCKINNIKITI